MFSSWFSCTMVIFTLFHTQMMFWGSPAPHLFLYVPQHIRFPNKEKSGDEGDEGIKTSQSHVLVFYTVVLCFLFWFWGTGDIPGTQLFGLNCKQLPTPISREQTLSPMGSAAYLCLWNHSNWVAFKRCHLTFSLLSRGTLHNPLGFSKWEEK